jgi:hypothetical protein
MRFCPACQHIALLGSTIKFGYLVTNQTHNRRTFPLASETWLVVATSRLKNRRCLLSILSLTDWLTPVKVSAGCRCDWQLITIDSKAQAISATCSKNFLRIVRSGAGSCCAECARWYNSQLYHATLPMLSKLKPMSSAENRWFRSYATQAFNQLPLLFRRVRVSAVSKSMMMTGRRIGCIYCGVVLLRKRLSEE